jgi:hypothetical protein
MSGELKYVAQIWQFLSYKSLIIMDAKKRVLLIDDDLDHLLTCNLILRRSGYEVPTLAGCEKMEELAEGS